MDLELEFLDNCISCGDDLFSALIHSRYKNYTANSNLVDSTLKPLLEIDNKDSFANIFL